MKYSPTRRDVGKILEIDDIDLILLKETIRYVPGYGIKYKYLSEQEQRKLIYGIVYGNVNANWSLYGKRLIEQNDKNILDLGSLLNMVKDFLFSVYLFAVKGMGTKKEDAEKKFNKILQTVKKSNQLDDALKKSLGDRIGYLSQIFSLVYDKVVDTFKEANKEGGELSKKSFILRWIYKFFGGVLVAYGETQVADPKTGKTITARATAGRKLTGVGVLLAIIIGVAAIILFLMTKLPVVGKLFEFLLKILTAPFRIFWKGLGFILRKLKVIS